MTIKEMTFICEVLQLKGFFIIKVPFVLHGFGDIRQEVLNLSRILLRCFIKCAVSKLKKV